jgi:hypothetical protein
MTTEHAMDEQKRIITNIIVEAIGNPDKQPGEWQAVTFGRKNANEIAEAIYEALKARGYLAENPN